MPTPTSSETFRSTLLDFAWRQWAQLGVSAHAEHRDRSAIDLEALLLLTLEVGASDPRLFDEALDWLVVNGRLLGVQRLHNLCRSDRERRLAEASLAWAGKHRSSLRLGNRRTQAFEGTPEELFPGTFAPTEDETFLSFGFRRPPVTPSGKSRPPELAQPASFGLRLRLIFGVGSRAEVMRYLLTAPAPLVDARVVAEATAFAKRNVLETLGALQAGGAIQSVTRGNERLYSADRDAWATLLGISSSDWPQHTDWQQLLRAASDLDRWLTDERPDELSPYLRASGARELVERLRPALELVGIPVAKGMAATGAEYWPEFVRVLEAVAARLA